MGFIPNHDSIHLYPPMGDSYLPSKEERFDFFLEALIGAALGALLNVALTFNTAPPLLWEVLKRQVGMTIIGSLIVMGFSLTCQRVHACIRERRFPRIE